MSNSPLKKYIVVFLLVFGSNIIKAQISSRAIQILAPTPNEEICSPTTLPISVQYINRDIAKRTLVTRLDIQNIVTHYLAYTQIDTIPNVPPGGSVNPVYAPYTTNPKILNQLGTFVVYATVSALDASNQPIKNWGFEDSSSLRIFGIRTSALPFTDPSDNYGVTAFFLIPDQIRWISSGTTITDGDLMTWDPPPPRYTLESGGVGPSGLLDPVLRFDRSDILGNLYSGTGVGDTLASFPFNLEGQTKVILTFDFMRGGRLLYPGFWDADTLSGPEKAIFNSNGEVVRPGDSLIIEFKDTAEPMCNPKVWNRIAAIDGGHDFEFKTFWLRLTTNALTYHITGDMQPVTVPIKNYFDSSFRFRLRLRANNNGIGNVVDDDDPWYVDNITLEVPRLPDIEVSWVRVVTPYSKIPFSAASNIPIYFSMRDYSVDAVLAIPVAVWITNKHGNIVYSDTIEVAALRGGMDSIIRMPDWNAQAALAASGDTEYRIFAAIASSSYDDYTQDNQTFSEFFLPCDLSSNAIQEFAYDDGDISGERNRGNDIPFITNTSGEGIGFNSMSGSYAMKFTLPHSDTIYGARIYFASGNQSPDPIKISLLQGDANSCVPGDAVSLPETITSLNAVRQGGLFDQFWLYMFPEPIAVSVGVYWLSVSQLSSSSIMMGGDFSRGGGEVIVENNIFPAITPIYSDKYGTQWSPDHTNGNVNCTFAVEKSAGSGSWSPWMPDNGYWPTNTSGNAQQLITWNPHLSPPFNNGGTYLPMIRVLVGSQSFLDAVRKPDGSSQLYPNLKILATPTTSSADFQFDALQESTLFELFDVFGKSLLRQQLSAGQASFLVDMQKYPAGIYFARLGWESVKVIKN